MSRQIIKVAVSKSRAVIAFYSNDGILTDPKFAQYLQEDRDNLTEVELADFVDHEVAYVIANIRKATQCLIDKLKTETVLNHKDFLRKLFEDSVENAANCAAQFNALVQGILDGYFKDKVLHYKCEIFYPDEMVRFFLRKAQDKLIELYPEYDAMCSEENIDRVVKERNLISDNESGDK